MASLSALRAEKSQLLAAIGRLGVELRKTETKLMNAPPADKGQYRPILTRQLGEFNAATRRLKVVEGLIERHPDNK